MKRCVKCEEAYETIDDDDISYIKFFNLSSKLMVNHIYGMLAKSIVPALMAWNIGTRPVYICRPGADTSSTSGGASGVPQTTREEHHRQTLVLSKKEGLDMVGKDFKDALHRYMRQECLDFAERRRNEIVKPKTNRCRGTFNIGGGLGSLSRSLTKFGLDDTDKEDGEPFPCHVATSTVPRAIQTADWTDMPSKALSNLNPLDKGEFSGLSMEEIAEKDPEWYETYTEDPFYTRYVSLLNVVLYAVYVITAANLC